MAWGRFGIGSVDDDQPTDLWMSNRKGDVAQRDALEAAGRERWHASTYSGENLSGRRSSDLVGLGRAGVAGPGGVQPAAGPQGQPWWESDAAKTATALGAYAAGGILWGPPRAVGHAVGDIWDAGEFGLQLAGAFGSDAQSQAQRQASDAAEGALRYAKEAVVRPRKVGSDLRDATEHVIDNISPFNADMSGSTWDVAKHQFRQGANFGEAATNVAGLFAGGELVQGVRAANAFEATRAANVAKFIDQGANPKLAEYLAQRYPGGGHHSVIPKRLAKKMNLPSGLVDSPINVAIPRGMSRGDFYEYHYLVDPKAGGFRLPADLNGGKGWRPTELGLKKYNLPQRLWYGTPVRVKDAMATIPFADAPTLYGELEAPQ